MFVQLLVIWKVIDFFAIFQIVQIVIPAVMFYLKHIGLIIGMMMI